MDDKIKELVAEYGAKNLRFFIPMRPLEYVGLIPGIAIKSSNTPEQLVECELNEDRYSIADNYKLTLRAINMAFGQEHFYITDFESLMARNPERYKVYAITIDGYHHLNPIAVEG